MLRGLGSSDSRCEVHPYWFAGRPAIGLRRGLVTMEAECHLQIGGVTWPNC